MRKIVKLVLMLALVALLAAQAAMAQEPCATSGVNPAGSLGTWIEGEDVSRLGYNPQIYYPQWLLELMGPRQQAALQLQLPKSFLLPGGAATSVLSAQHGYTFFGGTYFLSASAHTADDSPLAESVIDGVFSLGAGFGPPTNALEVVAAVTDISQMKDVFFNVKGHLFNETATAPSLAFGIENINRMQPELVENIQYEQALPSAYIAGSKTFWSQDRVEAGKYLMARTDLSLGFGTGRFGEKPFAVLATSLSPEMKIIGETVNNRYNAGISWASIKNPNMLLVMGWQDITDKSELTLGMQITLNPNRN